MPRVSPYDWRPQNRETAMNGAFQALWAAGILVKPNAIVLSAGVLVSALVIVIWALSRTAGVPIGPEAGEPEAAGLPDMLATAFEALIVLGGTNLLVRHKTAETPAREPAWGT